MPSARRRTAASVPPLDSIEIGGGMCPLQGWINLDPAHGEGTFRRRAQDGIPLPDASVRRARASHVMEHIPAGAERIFVMNEVWRVLAPGGTFEIIVPLLVPGLLRPEPENVVFQINSVPRD